MNGIEEVIGGGDDDDDDGAAGGDPKLANTQGLNFEQGRKIVSMSMAIFGFWLAYEELQSALETHQRDLVTQLYRLDVDINKIFVDQPHCYVAFDRDNDGKKFKSLSPDDQSKCRAIAEMFGDLFEYFLVLDGQVQDEEARKAWRDYAKETYDESYVFHQIIDYSVWTPALKRVVQGLPETAPTPGQRGVRPTPKSLSGRSRSVSVSSK